MTRYHIIAAAAVLFAAPLGSPARAQKNSGPLLPDSPPAYTPPAYTPPAYTPPAYTPPAYTPAPAYAPRPVAPPVAAPPPLAPPPLAAAPPAGGNPEANRLAQSLPLDPQTAALQNQLPPNPRATEARLGLREARGPVADLRGHTPSPREIVDALAPRR